MKTICLLMLALVCGAARAADPFADVAWLQGCWSIDGAEPGSFEHWSAPGAGGMVGSARLVRGGIATNIELLQLRSVDGGLEYVAQSLGEPVIVFVQGKAAPGELAFERAAPEFPHRLVVRKTDGGHFYSRVEGMLAGQPKMLEFPMTRVACEAK